MSNVYLRDVYFRDVVIGLGSGKRHQLKVKSCTHTEYGWGAPLAFSWTCTQKSSLMAIFFGLAELRATVLFKVCSSSVRNSGWGQELRRGSLQPDQALILGSPQVESNRSGAGL